MFCSRFFNSLVFHYHGLNNCNHPNHENTEHDFFPYERDYINKFLSLRKSKMEKMLNGTIDNCCISCTDLKNFDNCNDKVLNTKINFIEIFTFNECNCACFYCASRRDTKLKITNKKDIKAKINVVPDLMYLKDMDLLDKDCKFVFGGGEPTILKERKDILNFIIKNNYNVEIFTNGILYEKYVEKALKANKKSTILVSIDSGTRETFKKIKNVDKYNDVMKNIKKYIKSSKCDSNQVISKYIILKGVNDNKEEIEKWIKTGAKIGIRKFMPTIETCHSMEKIKNRDIDSNIVEMYNYAKSQIKDMGPEFIIETADFVEQAMNDICNK